MFARLPTLPVLPALLRQMPLKHRLVAATVGLLAVFMWAFAILAAAVLESRLADLLAGQQFASTRQLAAEFESKLQNRIDGLVRTAAGLPADLSHASLQPVLEQRPLMHVVFTGGIAVIGLDGKTIADYPVVPGRRGAWFGDRDYFRQVLATRKPYIDKPIIGRMLQRPVLTMAVPVFDGAGAVRAVLAGITDLTAPNVLNFVTDPDRVGQGEYYVISIKDHIFVAGTNPRRVLAPIPPRGRNLLLDRMFDGFEGSGIAVSSDGIEKLYSGKRIPAANWLLLAALPTEVAFAPVRTMRNYLFLFAALLTLTAIYVVRRIVVRRVLAPLDQAGAAIQRMTRGEMPLAPLPVGQDDEVGRLIGNFNRLVEERTRHEAALAESEQRFRALVEGAPDAIFVQVGGYFAYANPAALELFGVKTQMQLIGERVVDRVHPDFRAAVAERIRKVNAEGGSVPAMEQIYLRPDGTPVDVEVLAVGCRYGRESGSLVFVRDTSTRKAAERERVRQAQRLTELSHRLVATQENERRQLAAALHDSTSPNLATLDIVLRAAAEQPHDSALLLEDALALLRETTQDIRDVCSALRPAVLDYAGLAAALESYAQHFADRTGIAVRVDGRQVPRLGAEVESHLFRVAQEAMTNSAKHSGASAIDIRLSLAGELTTLTVADDGCGFVPDALGKDGRRQGLGLLTMRERAEFVGGRCVIESCPGAGTRVVVSMPQAGNLDAASTVDRVDGVDIRECA